MTEMPRCHQYLGAAQRYRGSELAAGSGTSVGCNRIWGAGVVVVTPSEQREEDAGSTVKRKGRLYSVRWPGSLLEEFEDVQQAGQQYRTGGVAGTFLPACFVRSQCYLPIAAVYVGTPGQCLNEQKIGAVLGCRFY